MDTPRQRLNNYWAKRFPEITDEWPYWWIEGDEYCLAVVDGNKLAAAVEIVGDNWERFSSIKVSVAKRIDGDLIRKKIHTDEISNREYSKQELETFIEESKFVNE